LGILQTFGLFFKITNYSSLPQVFQNLASIIKTLY
jgi:hypothetical protein